MSNITMPFQFATPFTRKAMATSPDKRQDNANNAVFFNPGSGAVVAGRATYLGASQPGKDGKPSTPSHPHPTGFPAEGHQHNGHQSAPLTPVRPWFAGTTHYADQLQLNASSDRAKTAPTPEPQKPGFIAFLARRDSLGFNPEKLFTNPETQFGQNGQQLSVLG